MIDLAITFVGEDSEIIIVRQPEKLSPLLAIGACAFRIGGRAEEGGHRPFQHMLGYFGEIGQESRFGTRIDVTRFGARCESRSRISNVEGIGNEDDRRATVLALGHQGGKSEKQSFARAVQGDDLPVRVDGAFGQIKPA